MRRFALISCLCALALCGLATWAMAGVGDQIADKALAWTQEETHFLLGAHGDCGYANIHLLNGRAELDGKLCLTYGGTGHAGEPCAGLERHHFDCVGFICQVFRDVGVDAQYLGTGPGPCVNEPYEVSPLWSRLAASGKWTWHPNPFLDDDGMCGDPMKGFDQSWASLHRGDVLIFAGLRKCTTNELCEKTDGSCKFSWTIADNNHSAICVAGSSNPDGAAIVSCRAGKMLKSNTQSDCVDANDSGVIFERLASFLGVGLDQFQNPGNYVTDCMSKGHAFLGYFSLGEACKPTALTSDIPALYCGDAANLCAYLKDELGNPVAGATVHFSINGSPLPDGTTGSDGRACSPWTPGHKGDYTLAYSFDNDDARNLCASSGSWPVHVDPDPTAIVPRPETTNCSDPFTFGACLKDDEGNPLAGRKLHFLIAGITYDGDTGQDGCVQLAPIYRCLGIGTYPVVVTWDGDDCYAPSQNQADLTVNCDPTSITDDESLPHVVQYSDVLTLGAWLKDDEGLELTGKLLGFNVGNQYGEDYTGPGGATGCQPDNDLTGRNGYASSSTKIDQPATICTPINSSIVFDGTDCYCAQNKPINVTINCETATLKTDWEELVRCDGTVGSGATVTLRANLTEEADGSYGDITKPGQIVFDIVQATENGDKVLMSVPATITAVPNPVPGGPPTIGRAEVTLPIAEGIYWITVSVPDKCWYCAEPDTDCLVVFCDGFVTGGGWIDQPDGVKKNFGFNLKYKKNSQSVPQGQFQYNDKAMGIKLHSTSWDWLVVDEVNHVAWFQGTGTINHAGSFDFLVKVTDKDEPGHPTDPSDTLYDTFSITIKPHGGGNTFPYPCGDPDICPIKDGEYKIVDCPLGGGNIQIHKPHSQ